MHLGKHLIILPFIPPHTKFAIILLSFLLGMVLLISFDEKPKSTEVVVHEETVESSNNNG